MNLLSHMVAILIGLRAAVPLPKQVEFLKALDAYNCKAIKSLILTYPPGDYDPTVRNEQALLYAVKDGDTQLVRMLLKDPRVDPSAGNFQAYKTAVDELREDVAMCFIEDSRVPIDYIYLSHTSSPSFFRTFRKVQLYVMNAIQSGNILPPSCMHLSDLNIDDLEVLLKVGNKNVYSRKFLIPLIMKFSPPPCQTITDLELEDSLPFYPITSIVELKRAYCALSAINDSCEALPHDIRRDIIANDSEQRDLRKGTVPFRERIHDLNLSMKIPSTLLGSLMGLGVMFIFAEIIMGRDSFSEMKQNLDEIHFFSNSILVIIGATFIHMLYRLPARNRGLQDTFTLSFYFILLLGMLYFSTFDSELEHDYQRRLAEYESGFTPERYREALRRSANFENFGSEEC